MCLIVSHDVNSGGEVNIEKSMRDAAAPGADARPRESIKNEQNKGKNSGDQAEVSESPAVLRAERYAARTCCGPVESTVLIFNFASRHTLSMRRGRL